MSWRNHIKEIVKKQKYPNIMGYSGRKKHRIKDGKVIPEQVIRVYVKEKKPLSELRPYEVIPTTIQNIPVDIVEHGELEIPTIQEALPDRKDEHEIMVGGISIGHPDITAGTLGFPTIKTNDDKHLGLLSNWHVLLGETGEIGDSTVQPGVYDGGENIIGHVLRADDLSDNSNCLISRFIIGVLNKISDIFRRKTKFKIYQEQKEYQSDSAYTEYLSSINFDSTFYGVEGGIEHTPLAPIVGMKVFKSGRTTGLTKGVIIDDNYNGWVNYGSLGNKFFVHQILIEGNQFSQGGDSGSIVYTWLGDKISLVGLLFAGSNTHTIANHLDYVLDKHALKIWLASI